MFEPKQGTNSLESLLVLAPNVLPFELKYVVGQGFTPGSQQFASTENFDPRQFLDFVGRFSGTVAEVKAIIDELFEFDRSKLAPEELLSILLASLLTSSSEPANRNQLTAIALMKLASTDRALSLMLFQFLLLTGLASSTEGQLFQRVVKDVKDISGFSFIKITGEVNLTGGLAALSTVIEQLANKIEQHVFVKTVGSGKPATNSLLSGFTESNTGKSQASIDSSKSLSAEQTGKPTDLQRESDPTQLSVVLPKGSIKALLTRLSLDTTSTVLKEFLNVANKLDQEASASYVLSDDSGRTRFSFISTTSLLLVLFETFIELTSRFLAGGFVGKDSSSLTVGIDLAVREALRETIKTVLPSSSPASKNSTTKEVLVTGNKQTKQKEKNAVKDVYAETALRGILNKIKTEDSIIQNVTHILDVISQQLVRALPNSDTSFRDGIELEQLKVAEWLLNKYQGARPNTVSTNDRNSLLALVSELPYIKPLASSRIKLLTVGIPTGFVNNITNRVVLGEEASSSDFRKGSVSGLLSVNVYKRTAEHDDVVFKPQKFLFDTDLFSVPMGTDQTVEFSWSFDKILKEFARLRATSHQRTVTLEELSKLEKYTTIPRRELRNLFKNHVVDGLLNIYHTLTTGLNLTEETFHEQEDSVRVSRPTESLIRKYYSDVRRTPLPAADSVMTLLNDTSVLSSQTRDELRLLVLGNIAFNSVAVESRILSPKAFDRVFTVPIDIDAFEIDKELTRKTESGKRAYSNVKFQAAIKRTGEAEFPDRVDNPLAVIMDDFFVVVEVDK